MPRAQQLQWFLSESTWEEREVQAERLTRLARGPGHRADIGRGASDR